MKVSQVVLSVLSLLIMLLLAIPPVYAGESDEMLKKDASHWNEYNDKDPQYKEWWYFNVQDNENDLQMFFVYNQNKAGRNVTANAFVGNEQVSVAETYSLLQSSASVEKCDITMGLTDNRKTFAQAWAVSPTEYRMLGWGHHNEDGSYIWWSLKYELIGKTWDPVNGDPIHWLVYMPNAKVSGTVGINGKTYKVEGKGYHDHNWGSWNFKDYPWVWIQANDLVDKKASMTSGGLLIDNKIVGGKTHFVYEDYQLDLLQSKQVIYTYSDNHNSDSFPTQMNIVIVDRRTPYPYGISIKTDAKKTMEIPLSGLTVYEQVCDVSLEPRWILSVNSTANPVLSVPVTYKGWCEYTSTS